MGTSKSYSASIKGQPQWGNLSSAVTSSCGQGTIGTNAIGVILSKYVGVIGGSGKAGRGNSKVAGKAGIRTARNIGRFLSAFNSSGGNLKFALEQAGLGDISGLSLNDVIKRLLEFCTGPSSTLDDVAAKAASQKILEELAGEAETMEEWQEHLTEVLDSETLESITERYFGYYVFEHLSIMFYEKLIVEKGKSDCDTLFKQIKDFIFEKIKNMNRTNPLNNINWNSDDSDRLIKNIQEDVLKVFEGYED
jgi:hypothetical protein